MNERTNDAGRGLEPMGPEGGITCPHAIRVKFFLSTLHLYNRRSANLQDLRITLYADRYQVERLIISRRQNRSTLSPYCFLSYSTRHSFRQGTYVDTTPTVTVGTDVWECGSGCGINGSVHYDIKS